VRVHAVVADVRIREGDHLPGVRRIGDDLLVAGERGVEHHLADRGLIDRERCSGEFTLEGGAVGEHEKPGVDGGAHRWASRLITTGSPRSIVWRTRPVSVRPAKGVLRDLLATWAGSTTHCSPGSMTHRLAALPTATGKP
jgi:hypothetical protein